MSGPVSSDSSIDPPLSDEQRAVVMSKDRAIAVIASAGSGKTEVVARRAQRLLQHDCDDGQKVLALSYTKKAADELRSRLNERLGALAAKVETDTVHGFAYTLIREHGTKIGLPVEPELLVRDEDRVELLTRWLQEQGNTVPDDAGAVLHELDLLRARNHRSPLLDEWEAALTSAAALDYPALLSAARELFESKSTRRQLSRIYTHLIVDEAQNLTPAQYDLLTALIEAPDDGDVMSTMLVGDDKQSIVSFAGADPRLIARFVNDYQATTFGLRTNFRSATAMSVVSSRIALALGHTPVESVDDENGAPGLITYQEAHDEEAEGDLVATWISDLLRDGIPAEALSSSDVPTLRPDDIAVLGRSSAALRFTGKSLAAKGISFVSSSGAVDWLDSTPAKIVLEIIGLRSTSDHQSVHWQLARLLDVDSSLVTTVSDLRHQLLQSGDPAIVALAPLCDIDDVRDFVAAVSDLAVPESAETSQLAAWQSDLDQLRESWTEFDQTVDRAGLTWAGFKLFCSRQQRGDDLAPGVRLLTIHKAQGREFRAVALVGLNDGQLPDFRAHTANEQLAELRTFYVAVTRARRALLITRPSLRSTRYGSRRSAPSPFLRYLDPPKSRR